MGFDVEFGRCEVCGKDAPLSRKYFRYNIKCECCSPNHFEFKRHCKECTPVEPRQTKLTIKPGNILDIVPDSALLDELVRRGYAAVVDLSETSNVAIDKFIAYGDKLLIYKIEE